jgi:hypothetical protein
VTSGGVAIQQWGSPQLGCKTTDPETGNAVDCTPDCEVLGHTRPEFDVVDDNNPATGGVLLRHAGLVPALSDQYGCQIDPRTGYPRERLLDIVLQCDKGLSRNSIVPVSFVEVNPGQCYYRFTLRTGAACAYAGDPFDPAAPVANDGPNNFGFVVLGFVLVVGLQFATAWAAARGYLSNLPLQLHNIPVLGDLISRVSGSVAPSSGEKSFTSSVASSPAAATGSAMESVSSSSAPTTGSYQSSGGYNGF